MLRIAQAQIFLLIYFSLCHFHYVIVFTRSNFVCLLLIVVMNTTSYSKLLVVFQHPAVKCEPVCQERSLGSVRLSGGL